MRWTGLPGADGRRQCRATALLGLFHSISVIPLMHATNPTQRQWRLGARADLASEPTGRNRQSPWQPWKDVMNTELSQTTDATDWGEPFDPMRTGFDHMELRVADPSRLDEWEEHFQRLDVNHTPTVHADYGSVLTFRDPDMRQCEMFYRAIHP
jgi:hypothetical protein